MTSEKACCPPVQSDSCCETQPENSTCCPPPEDKQPCCAPKEPSNSCCPEPETASACCPPKQDRNKAGYSLEAFVAGWQETSVGDVPVIKRKLSRADHYGRWAMRWGIGRDHYLITPGLYAIGAPDENSEVLVSANYKLSFDVLRSSLQNIDAWILVLDTRGVNVWCAAGKGTFGTDEIIRQVKNTKLEKLVGHRRLIVPQLGAPGVSAHKVKKGCDFSVVYGPVKASDLPAFLESNREATPEMRRVSFTLLERTILTPVEITILRKQILYTLLALFILGGIGSHFFTFSAAWSRGGAASLTGFGGLIAGCVISPILLPWLPGRAFALKGVWPGLAMALILCLSFFGSSGFLIQAATFLQITAISSYAAMNFTGSSTYTSPSGVEKEMRLAIPCQLASVILALGLWLWSAF